MRQKPYNKYLRYPKTIQEIRRNHCDEIDGIKVRASRSKRQLPTAYDDIVVRAKKCWKNHRKTRWNESTKKEFNLQELRRKQKKLERKNVGKTTSN